ETLALRLRRTRDAELAHPPGRDAAPRVSRTTTRDGHPIAPRDLIGRWPVVLFWPDDLQLVKAGPEARRRLLDILVSQLDRAVADELIRYRRVLEQRNSLLRRLHDGGGPADQLRPFDDALLRHGAAVQVARTELVGALAPLAAAAMAEISEEADSLELRYAPQSGAASNDREQVLAALTSALARARGEELARGTSVVGPHRDDLEFVLNGRPARSAASQGQQRSAVLATKIAEVRLVGARAERMPILLLDDVLSELDPARREHLLSALSARGEAPQTMVTCSDDYPFGAHPSRHFLVRQGTVSAGGVAGWTPAGGPSAKRDRCTSTRCSAQRSASSGCSARFAKSSCATRSRRSWGRRWRRSARRCHCNGARSWSPPGTALWPSSFSSRCRPSCG